MPRLCREVFEAHEQPTHVEVPDTPAGRRAARVIRRLNRRRRWHWWLARIMG